MSTPKPPASLKPSTSEKLHPLAEDAEVSALETEDDRAWDWDSSQRSPRTWSDSGQGDGEAGNQKLPTLQGLHIRDSDLRAHDAPEKRVCPACSSSQHPAIDASVLGHLNCLQLLHAAGLVVGCRDFKGITPLHSAAIHGHAHCLAFLLERTGGDIHARDGKGFTATRYACHNGHLPCLKVLFSIKSSACLTGNDIEGGTLAHYTASSGHLACLVWACSPEVGVDPTETNDDGFSPLYFAAQEGHLNCIKWLAIKGKCRVTQAGLDGMCPIHAAALAGKLDCLSFLLKQTNESVHRMRDNDGATPIHIAAAKGHTDCLRLLLEQPNTFSNDADNYGSTPCHDAAEAGQLQTLKVLVAHGSKLNVLDEDGATPYSLALANKFTDCAQWILFYLRSESVSSPSSSPTDLSAWRAAQEEAELVSELDFLRSHVGRMGAVNQQLQSLVQMFVKPERRASLSSTAAQSPTVLATVVESRRLSSVSKSPGGPPTPSTPMLPGAPPTRISPVMIDRSSELPPPVDRITPISFTAAGGDHSRKRRWYHFLKR